MTKRIERLEELEGQAQRVMESEEPEPDEEAAPEPEPDDDEATDEEIGRALRGGIDVEIASSGEVARRIVDRIMQAQSAEELWEPIVPVGAREVSETPIRIFDFQVLRSSMEGPVGVYLVIDAVDLRTGERLLVTCGATNVVAKLIQAARLKALPENLKFTITPSRANPDQTIIDLRLVPAELLP